MLHLTMRLAQVAAANARGDQFIRRSPALAIMLADRDAYRRLFNDRSGWRGARSARLTIAHSFAGEIEEAEIQRDRAVGWINWHSELATEHETRDQSGPGVSDFAAVIFGSIARGNFDVADRNLVRWNREFALSVSTEVAELAWLFERYGEKPLLSELAGFAASSQCNSFALKASLLASPIRLSRDTLKSLSRSAAATAAKYKSSSKNLRHDSERRMDGDIVQAALTALFHGSRSSA